MGVPPWDALSRRWHSNNHNSIGSKNFERVESPLILKESKVERVIHYIKIKKENIIKRNECLPIPRRGWLKGQNKLSAPKSCVDVILKDC